MRWWLWVGITNPRRFVNVPGSAEVNPKPDLVPETDLVASSLEATRFAGALIFDSFRLVYNLGVTPRLRFRAIPYR